MPLKINNTIVRLKVFKNRFNAHWLMVLSSSDGESRPRFSVGWGEVMPA